MTMDYTLDVHPKALVQASNLSISPDVFLRLDKGSVSVWHVGSHQQWHLDDAHVQRLVAIARCGGPPNSSNSEIDRALIDAGLVLQGSPRKPVWGWDALSWVFHRGTKDIPITHASSPTPDQWVDEYLRFCSEIIDDQPNMHTERDGPRIALPRPVMDALAAVPILHVLEARKTIRSFSGGEISLGEASTLLHTAFGQIHGTWSDLEENNMVTTGMRKASPSGGGLHPEEAYIVALRVDGLKPGIYHFRPQDHSLTLIRDQADEQLLIALLWDQYYARGMALGVFITARFDKAWWKYPHSRAYRNVLLDVGHVSQTFLLSATALGLQTWLTGAFQDGRIEEVLGVDGEKEGVVFFVGCGHGDDRSFDDTILRRLESRERD